MKLNDSADLICSGILIIVIIIIEGFYLKMCIILIIVITTNTIIKYLIFSSCNSDRYIISKCPEQDLSSLFFFLIHRDLSSPSHCSHTWVQRWHLSLWCRWGAYRQPVRSTSALPPLFLPVPLQRCRLPLAALGSLSAISSHRRWCNKGDTWRNIRLIAVATATEKTWEMY